MTVDVFGGLCALYGWPLEPVCADNEKGGEKLNRDVQVSVAQLDGKPCRVVRLDTATQVRVSGLVGDGESRRLRLVGFPAFYLKPDTMVAPACEHSECLAAFGLPVREG